MKDSTTIIVYYFYLLPLKIVVLKFLCVPTIQGFVISLGKIIFKVLWPCKEQVDLLCSYVNEEAGMKIYVYYLDSKHCDHNCWYFLVIVSLEISLCIGDCIYQCNLSNLNSPSQIYLNNYLFIKQLGAHHKRFLRNICLDNWPLHLQIIG